MAKVKGRIFGIMPALWRQESELMQAFHEACLRGQREGEAFYDALSKADQEQLTFEVTDLMVDETFRETIDMFIAFSTS